MACADADCGGGEGRDYSEQRPSAGCEEAGGDGAGEEWGDGCGDASADAASVGPAGAVAVCGDGKEMVREGGDSKRVRETVGGVAIYDEGTAVVHAGLQGEVIPALQRSTMLASEAHKHRLTRESL